MIFCQIHSLLGSAESTEEILDLKTGETSYRNFIACALLFLLLVFRLGITCNPSFAKSINFWSNRPTIGPTDSLHGR